MSGRHRTFVLQVAGVALLVGIIFVAFLRPSDPGELAGIDAPEGDTHPFGLPGLGRDEDGRDGSEGHGPQADSQAADQRRSGGGPTSVAGAGSDGGSGILPTSAGPPGDQYTSTAVALMERVRAAYPGGDR